MPKILMLVGDFVEDYEVRWTVGCPGGWWAHCRPLVPPNSWQRQRLCSPRAVRLSLPVDARQVMVPFQALQMIGFQVGGGTGPPGAGGSSAGGGWARQGEAAAAAAAAALLQPQAAQRRQGRRKEPGAPTKRPPAPKIRVDHLCTAGCAPPSAPRWTPCVPASRRETRWPPLCTTSRRAQRRGGWGRTRRGGLRTALPPSLPPRPHPTQPSAAPAAAHRGLPPAGPPDVHGEAGARLHAERRL